MSEKLLGDFDEVSREDWQQKITADLKGKPYDTLFWESEGIKGGPVYTQEDLESIENLAALQNNSISDQPEIYGARNWVNYQLITVENESKANQLALEALNLGAEGLTFLLTKPVSLGTLLDKIQLEHCAVAFEIVYEAPSFINEYFDYIQKKNYPLEKVNGFINTTQLEFEKSLNTIGQIQNLRCLNIKLPNQFEAVNTVQELALLLHRATSQILASQQSGMSLNKILNTSQFQVRIGKNYFIEIAKLRALRLLVQAMWKGFDINTDPSHVMIFSSSNNWEFPVDDKHNYLLEATTNAMAAILGGCNALLIRPFNKTFENQPALALRNARNISSILKEESYLAKVTDASAGSYYIESVTNQLIDKAWSLFLKIEKASANEAINISILNHLTAEND